MTEANPVTTSEVEHGDVLIAFADAIVSRDEATIAHTRDAVLQSAGPDVMVDAAGVASNFERMVRIADATGIPLDERLERVTQEVRDELQLDRLAAGKN